MTKLMLIGLAAFILFIILDLAWFSFAGDFFKAQIGSIARLSADGVWHVRYLPAALVYVFMAIGIVVFVLPNAESLSMAILLGGLFGLVTYGMYDMTNLATLRAWTYTFAIADMTWGTFLSATISGITYFLSRHSLLG